MTESTGDIVTDLDDIDPVCHSTAWERLLELTLMSELTQEAWFGRRQILDVMHSTVDAFGHDVVLECGRVLRHVQLKSRALSAGTSKYSINLELTERPSGCVIWMGWERLPDTDRVRMEYRWFGGEPGEPLGGLGDRRAKHTRANSQGIKSSREALREVRLTQFEKLTGVPHLLDKLFGPAVAPVVHDQ
jgi:hypothetical protein